MKYWFWSLKDKVVNFILNAYNWLLYNILQIKLKAYLIPDGYTLNYFDDFTKLSLEELNTKYLLSQPWLDYLPSNLQQWYDPAGSTIDSNGLNLSVTQNTFTVTTYDVNGVQLDNQPPVIIPHGIGLVVSNQLFQYGIYEWNIKLPVGAQLWPAIWLSGHESWPPEIDILEGYTDDSCKYGRSVNTNIHCGSNPQNHYGIGANRHGLFINTNEFLNLVCHWTKDYIKIYYNGFLCRVLTNPTDLAWFNENKHMVVIMNTALRTNITERVDASPLIVKDFKYYTI